MKQHCTDEGHNIYAVWSMEV